MKGNLSFNGIKLLLFTVVALVSTAAMAQTQFKNTEFFKSAAPGEKKGGSVKGSLNFDSANKQIIFQDGKGNPALKISNDSVKHLLYERTSKPRYVEGILIAWPLLLTKSKKHYLTLQYDEPAGTGHYAILRLDKGNYQQILAMAEAQTGKQVERTEER